jgi:hypothetical protein
MIIGGTLIIDQPDGGPLVRIVSAASMHDLRLKSKRENGRACTSKPSIGNAWRYRTCHKTD